MEINLFLTAGLQNLAWDGMATLVAGICIDRLFRIYKKWSLLGWLLGAGGAAYWAWSLAAWPEAARWIWVGTVGLGTVLAYFLSARDQAPAARWWLAERAQNVFFSFFWLSFAAAVWVKNAWVSDDAYITFRTVDNFLHGYGLRWNIVERVQAYTHPLWMWLVAGSAAVSREFYYTSISLGIGFTLAALLWFWHKTGLPRENWILPAVGLTFSKALVEFSTSGLENSLSYALVVWFYILALQEEKTPRRFFLLTVLLTLSMLNRMDLALLLGVPWLWLFWEQGKARGFKAAAWESLLAFSPLLVWEIFSWIYYGFGVPNTAFAKLGSGLPWQYFFFQGGRYFINSLATDPVTLGVTGLGVAFGLLAGERRKQMLALGLLAYLAYVLKIGGDFMSGRFFSVPFLGALILLSVSLNLRFSLSLLLAGFILVCNLLLPYHPWREVEHQYLQNAQSGIMDEQGYYYSLTGLLRAAPQKHFNNGAGHDFTKFIQAAEESGAAGEGLLVSSSVGLVGYFAGPKIYVVDLNALANPFLAHIPSLAKSRIGHFERKLPGGYLETLRTGQMKIINPEAAKLYTRMERITRAPIWDKQRWRDIFSEALGREAGHLDPRYYQTNFYWDRKLLERKYPGNGAYDRLMQAGREAFMALQLAKAEHFWQQAKQLDPKPGDAQRNLAYYYAWLGDFSLAAENAQQAGENNFAQWGNVLAGINRAWQDEAVQ